MKTYFKTYYDKNKDKIIEKNRKYIQKCRKENADYLKIKNENQGKKEKVAQVYKSSLRKVYKEKNPKPGNFFFFSPTKKC